MEPFAFIDIDGTLADLVSPLAKVHGVALDRTTWPATYTLSEALGIHIDDIWRAVEGPEFWRSLPKLPWADELVDAVRSRFGTDRIAFLTQTVRDPGCAAGKAAWCREHFPRIPFSICTKKVIHAAPGFVLIDDHEEHETAWCERGGNAVLVPAPWNRLRGRPDDAVLPHVVDMLDFIEAARAKGYA